MAEQAVPNAQAIPEFDAGGSIVSYPYFWQLPAATEKAAYDSMVQHAGSTKQLQFEYFGFPWATIIDGARARSPQVSLILGALRSSLDAKGRNISPTRRATVAQHIHAVQFIDLFSAAGITDLFWSHATVDSTQAKGIRLHPFALFPAQAPDYEFAGVEKPLVANFIGAYNPDIYLTNVRAAIFDDIGKYRDVLIIKRDSWHYDRIVYEEQIKNLKASEVRKAIETRMAHEYKDAIRESWFTLCPSGSGPNSIRIFESLNLQSIPIILTKQLMLPGPIDLWERAAIIGDDSVEGYRQCLERARNSTLEERKAMLRAGRDLANLMSPRRYARLLMEMLQA